MIHEILEQSLLNNSIKDYLTSFIIFIIGIVLIRVVKYFIISNIKKFTSRTKNKFDDFLIQLIEQATIPFLFLLIIYASISGLKIHPSLRKAFSIASGGLVTFLCARFCIKMIEYSLLNYVARKRNKVMREEMYKGILPAIKVFVWGIAIVFLLDNLGFEISAVVASLGIGGVAVALASQAILADLFSYFAILFDRPFEVGDFIIVGDYLGAIERIGIKTTRIRSLGGEQLVFSNTDLTNSRVRNYKRMQKRRVVFKLGVTYQTNLDKIKEIPQIIKQIIKNIDNTVFDRAHFASYGDFSLVFEIVYYVMSSDYNVYMDIQQNINFNIKQEFEKRGIEFAYPTQTLFIEKDGIPAGGRGETRTGS